MKKVREKKKSTHPLIYNIKHIHIVEWGWGTRVLYPRSHIGVRNKILILSKVKALYLAMNADFE